MEKTVLKQVLDEIAADSGVLARTSTLLSSGPRRSLIIDSSGITLHLNDSGCAFYWDPADPRTAVASLVATGAYEPIELRILSTLAASSAVALDIGANVGFYAVFMGRAIGPTGRLHCFEPLLSSFQHLTRNIALNNLQGQVTSHNLALSDSQRIEELHVPQISGTSATSMRNLHPEEKSISHKIRTETLDSWSSQNAIEEVDLIKIDVEGAERLVIQGGWSLISTRRPVIFAELLRKWSAGFGYHPQQVVAELASLGYQCFAVGEKLREVSRIDEDTVETNFVFLTSSDSHRQKLRDLTHAGLTN